MTLKKIDYQIIFELMKNSKISDRRLAKKLGVSQPTVTRRRTRLEQENILNYTTIPNFEKLGLGILAVSFVHYDHSVLGQVMNREKSSKMIFTTLSKHPNIIFASSGRGLGFEGIAISVHKNYADFAAFTRTLKIDWAEYAHEIKSFLVSNKSDNVVKELTFKDLGDYIHTNNSE
ncbi:MAG: winged helix-turn-helix transcriptional regulator [Candidatus Bathyarchaeota archaeon]|nr:MAG: winged helix-turn-helix transcriptional regulator [Candidatus Bathyarchaeota archaeon]